MVKDLQEAVLILRQEEQKVVEVAAAEPKVLVPAREAPRRRQSPSEAPQSDLPLLGVPEEAFHLRSRLVSRSRGVCKVAVKETPSSEVLGMDQRECLHPETTQGFSDSSF